MLVKLACGVFIPRRRGASKKKLPARHGERILTHYAQQRSPGKQTLAEAAVSGLAKVR
ncbi:MAG: hypothetical protein ACHRHE_21800 [Tepidisphaerales bacterium]